MIGHFGSVQAPNLDESGNEFADYCTQFRQRQDALTLIRQLNQLSKAVQRHRGMSMALLAGNTVFRGDFDILQRQVERRLASLAAFASQCEGLVGGRERDNLRNAWQTIREGWHDDDVIDNFELHSHFVLELQGLINVLSRQLEKPVSVLVAEARGFELIGNESTTYPKMFKQIELLNFATRQVPIMVEQLARIRGLATYAAAKGHCDYHHDRKLRYEISCARASNEKLRHQAERLEGILGGAVVGLSMVKTYELKLMFLLNTVEMDVLSGTTITANSHQLFKLATEIIDVYLTVVDESVDVLGLWHDQDSEVWLQWVGPI